MKNNTGSGEGELQEGGAMLDHKSQEKGWFQILAICTAALSSLSSSIIFTWPSPTIPKLLEENFPGASISSTSYFTVIPPLATVIFSPLCSIIADKYGRKYPLIGVGVLHILSWICVIFAKRIDTYYLSRFFFGIADTGMFGVLPVYIAEISTPKIRGTWGNAMGLGIYLGQLIMNAFGYYFSIKVSAYILITLPITFILLFVNMPETPYFYLMKGKLKEAEKSLKRLRRTSDVQEELFRISQDIQKKFTPKPSVKDCFKNRTNRKSILICSLTRVMQQLSGISAFAVYIQLIFHEGIPSINRGIASIVYTGSLVISILIGSFLTDRMGRKTSLTASCFGCAFFLTLESIYFYLKTETDVDLINFTWFPLLGMICYVFVFSFGLALTPLLLLSELFSSAVRANASSILTVVYCCCIGITTKFFQVLTTSFGLYVPFGFFALFTYISAILSYFYVPETKGKTLEEIQDML